VAVPSVGGGAARVVAKRELTEILQPRAEEIFHLVREDLAKSVGEASLRGGIVLTGGGAQLDGLLELTGQAFNASVRYGLPQGLAGLVDVINSPGWSTAAGLLHYGMGAEQNEVRRPRRAGFSVRGMMGSLKSVFSDLL
jgi:cell division protein FtsA